MDNQTLKVKTQTDPLEDHRAKVAALKQAWEANAAAWQKYQEALQAAGAIQIRSPPILNGFRKCPPPKPPPT